MRRFWLRVGVAGLFGVLGCAKAERPPQIVFETAAVDLGVLDPGASEFMISFRNVGTKPLLVGKVDATCSCTTAEATPTVEPAGAGTVRGKIKVSGGPGGAKLTLTSNDPAGPSEIRVKWFGKAAPVLMINALNVAMKVGVAATEQVEVSYPAGDPPVALELVGWVGLPDGSKVTLAENNPAAIKSLPGLSVSMTVAPSPFVGKAILRIDLPTPTRPGSTAHNGIIKFAQRGRPVETSLKLTIWVDEGLRVTPGSILFSAGDFEALRQIRRKVILTSDELGDQFQVVEKPAYLGVNLIPTAAKSVTRAILTVEVAVPPPPGEENSRLVLENSAGRRVTVPLSLHLGVNP